MKLLLPMMSIPSRSSLLVFIPLFLMTACGLLPQSPYRQALPDTASEVLEHRSGGVDFTYLLRARVTETEFRAYVDELGLSPVKNAAWDDTGVIKPSKPHKDDPDWWSPIRSVDRAFQLHQDSDIITAKYENGLVYLSVVHL